MLNNFLIDLNSRVSKLEESPRAFETATIEEINEKTGRSHNIILFDLIESDQNDDNVAVKDILSKTGIDCTQNNLSLWRFGRKSLLIRFKSLWK